MNVDLKLIMPFYGANPNQKKKCWASIPYYVTVIFIFTIKFRLRNLFYIMYTEWIQYILCFLLQNLIKEKVTMVTEIT